MGFSLIAAIKQFLQDNDTLVIIPPPEAPVTISRGSVTPVENTVINIAKLQTLQEIDAALVATASEGNVAAVNVLKGLGYDYTAPLRNLAEANDAGGVKTILANTDLPSNSIDMAFIAAAGKNNTAIMEILDKTGKTYEAVRPAGVAAAQAGATEAMAYVAEKIVRKWKNYSEAVRQSENDSYYSLRQAFEVASKFDHPETAAVALRTLQQYNFTQKAPQQSFSYHGKGIIEA